MDRRRFVLTGASVTTIALAGCTDALDDDGDDDTQDDTSESEPNAPIDIWLENEESGEFGYELRVGDFEAYGIIGHDERDTWEGALERGDEPRDIDIEVRMGFWSESDGDEFHDALEDEDELERKVEQDELSLVETTGGTTTVTIDETVHEVFVRHEADGLVSGTVESE